MIKKITAVSIVSIVIGSTITTSVAIAGPASEALSACFADNTTGKDRKDMARWVYVGMSVHPEIRNLSTVTEINREEMDRKMATVFTRLITESCPTQAKSAVDKEGSAGLQTAFGTIGRLAMQELMSNQEVNSSFTNFSKYLDKKKINSVFEKK